ncbi:MAG TPA: urease accessory protein UreE, partial [Nevskia sp.]|nr:urease accessory protein UreE [Nevskia sp.]
MKRVTAIKPAGEWDAGAARDAVVLDAQDRHRRRVVFVGEEGATYLLDLPRPAQLRDGDALVIEDGTFVRVSGKPEPLVEIGASSAHELA